MDIVKIISAGIWAILLFGFFIYAFLFIGIKNQSKTERILLLALSFIASSMLVYEHFAVLNNPLYIPNFTIWAIILSIFCFASWLTRDSPQIDLSWFTLGMFFICIRIFLLSKNQKELYSSIELSLSAVIDNQEGVELIYVCLISCILIWFAIISVIVKNSNKNEDVKGFENLLFIAWCILFIFTIYWFFGEGRLLEPNFGDYLEVLVTVFRPLGILGGAIGITYFFLAFIDTQAELAKIQAHVKIPEYKERYSQVSDFDQYGLAVTYNSNKNEHDVTLMGLINEKGKEILPPKYLFFLYSNLDYDTFNPTKLKRNVWALEYYKHYNTVIVQDSETGKYGVIDTFGNWVIENNYENIEYPVKHKRYVALHDSSVIDWEDIRFVARKRDSESQMEAEWNGYYYFNHNYIAKKIKIIDSDN